MGETDITLAHLQRFCEDERPWLARPFVVAIDGDKWVVATDGKMMIAVRGDHGATEIMNDYKVTADAAVGLIKEALSPIAYVDVDASTLASFCGPADFTTKTTCTDCGGTGSKCSCLECQCDSCDGDGFIHSEATERKGFIRERFCNLNRLACLLDGRSGTVKLNIGSAWDSPMTITGDGWAALLMPMRMDDDDKKNQPNMPRWNYSTTEAA
jgi:hypothetical protein